MGQFTESLTILIQGDSSGLQRELEEAASLLGDFQSRLSQLSGWSQQLGNALDRVGSTRSLANLSNSLDRIFQQIQRINNTPITLNVAPAMASLTTLSATLDVILAQMMAVSAAGMLSAAGGLGGVPSRVMTGFAVGGPVLGEPGYDKVPAWLTAGEFVLNRQAVDELGHSFVTALNHHPVQAVRELAGNGISAANRSPGFSWPAAAASVSVGNRMSAMSPPEERVTRVMNVGGMNIHVHQDLDPEGVLRSLRIEGVGLRNRRG